MPYRRHGLHDRAAKIEKVVGEITGVAKVRVDFAGEACL